MIKLISQCLFLLSICSLVAESKPMVDGKVEAHRQIMSANPTMRRSAVLLLGKFEDSESMTAIINAIGDSDALVRHSAMTAINEYLMVNSSAIIMELKQVNQRNNNRTISAVFRMVVDSDVDNRRLASKLAVTIGRLLGFRPEFLPEVVQKQILESYGDSDAIVRFNMFSNYAALKKITPNEILLKGLEDPSDYVQKEALEKLVYYERDLAIKHLGKLMKTREESSRILIMKNFCYKTTIKSVATLFEQLLSDPNPVVAAYAMYGLTRIKQYPTEEQLNQVLDGVGKEEMNLGRNIINSVGRLPRYKVWLSKKYKDESSPFYPAILTVYIQQFRDEIPVKELLGWFNQSDTDISRTASYVLSHKKITLDQFLPLVDSEYTHVRLSLITISYRLNKNERAELLSLLILDDDANVQAQALRNYGNLKLADYLIYAEAALAELNSQRLLIVAIKIFNDNQPALVRRIKTDAAFKSIFKKALIACPRARVSSQIKTLLVEVPK